MDDNGHISAALLSLCVDHITTRIQRVYSLSGEHCFIGQHASKIGLIQNDLCRRCQHYEEKVKLEYILCTCRPQLGRDFSSAVYLWFQKCTFKVNRLLYSSAVYPWFLKCTFKVLIGVYLTLDDSPNKLQQIKSLPYQLRQFLNI